MWIEPGIHAVHEERTKTLCLRYRAVFVGEQKGLQVDNLFTKLGDCCCKSIIFAGE